MPSRINIGPENGPYVAINEENGNLQLEDNSGNVVAEWDETNAQWDFANNTLNNVDALNSNSVSTEVLASDERAGWGEPVIDVSVAPDTPTFSFALDSPLDEGEEILIDILQIGAESSGTEIRLNVDELDDNRFWYRKSNEPPTAGANQWFLTDIPTSNMGFSGDLIVRETRFDTAVLPNVTIAETEGQVIQEGGCDDTGAQNFEIELIDVGGDEFINLDFKVYRREVSVK